MIESEHKKLSVRCQAALLGINRNRLPKDSGRAESPPSEDLAILKDLDALHLRWPFYGQRKLRLELCDRGWDLGRQRLRRLMRQAGIVKRDRKLLKKLNQPEKNIPLRRLTP